VTLETSLEMHMTRSVVVVLTALALLAPSLAAQQAFRAAIRTVPVYATVTDDDGRLVPDLLEEHFEIYDNGKLQAITNFTSDVQPITVVVMLDTSGSMTLNLDLLKLAAEQFVIRLLPDDRARVGSFSDKIILSSQFTGDRDELVRILREDIQFGNPTRLWDAVDYSMSELADQEGRRVVLMFSDGDDTDSQVVGRGDVIERAQAEGFMVYGIGLRSRYHNGQRWVNSRPDRGLRQLAEETGGGYFELDEAQDLGAAFTRVADELHRQYVLGFSPEVLDGEVHELEVKIKIRGMEARARKSYLATPTTAGVAPVPPGETARR
jgi:Ca-activated chloride channel family protein